MAAIPSKKRPSLRAKARTTPSSSKPSTTPSLPTPSGTFSATKKDKRTIKRSAFVNRITKAHNTPAKKRRRRPSKKLVATLESLADALPDDVVNDGEKGGVVGEDGGAEATTVVGQARIRHKSLRTRPGAMKRKEKVERMERERFERNMAQMVVGAGALQTPAQPQTQAGAGAGAGAAPVVEGATADRWAALRGFIEATMERKREFQEQQGG